MVIADKMSGAAMSELVRETYISLGVMCSFFSGSCRTPRIGG